eukprot:254845_1
MRRGGSGVVAMLSFACRVPLKAAFFLSSARGSHKAPSSVAWGRPCGWERGWRAIVGQTGASEDGTKTAERQKQRIRLGGTEILNKKNKRAIGATLLPMQRRDVGFASAAGNVENKTTTKVSLPSCIPEFGRVIMTPSGPEPKQPLGEYEIVASRNETCRTFIPIREVGDAFIDTEVWVKGRVHSLRAKGGRTFLVLRGE